MDLISELPDLALSKILSFLPTKNAVAAAILSTRWRNISPFLGNPLNLSFDDSLVLHEQDEADFVSNFMPESRGVRSNTFPDFVNAVLVRNNRADYIGVYCKRTYDNGVIERSIRTGVRRLQISHLIMSLSNVDCKLLLKGISGSATLTRIELQGNFDLQIEDDFRLPALKKLYLSGLRFRNRILGVEGRYIGSINELLIECPLIENLHLKFCRMGLLQNLKIQSPFINEIIIENRDWQAAGELVVEAESLTLLKCTGTFTKSCYTNSFQTLVAADIDCIPIISMIKDHTAKLVNSCCSTVTLSLKDNSTEALHQTSVSLAMFQNLRILELYRPGLKILACFLRSSPHLEILIIEKGLDKMGGKYADFVQLLVPDYPIHFNLHVKEIEWGMPRGYLGDFELEVIEYFLAKGENMQKLTIYTDDDEEDESISSRLKRLTSQCKILFNKKKQKASMITSDFELANN